MRSPRIPNANAADRPAFKMQMHLECRLLAAFRVQVQTFGHALGSAVECAFALCVLWVQSVSGGAGGSRRTEANEKE